MLLLLCQSTTKQQLLQWPDSIILYCLHACSLPEWNLTPEVYTAPLTLHLSLGTKCCEHCTLSWARVHKLMYLCSLTACTRYTRSARRVTYKASYQPTWAWRSLSKPSSVCIYGIYHTYRHSKWRLNVYLTLLEQTVPFLLCLHLLTRVIGFHQWQLCVWHTVCMCVHDCMKVNLSANDMNFTS